MVVGCWGETQVSFWDMARRTKVRSVDVELPKNPGPLAGFFDSISCVAASGDGSYAAVGGYGSYSKIRLMDGASGMTVCYLPTEFGKFGDVTCLEFGSGHTFLAAGRSDGIVDLWDVPNRRILNHCVGDAHQINDVDFTRDGSQLATSCNGGEVRVWDVPSGRAKRVLEGHRGAVSSVAFSPDGDTLATGGSDGTVGVWDVAAGVEISRVNCPHAVGTGVRSLAFSQDGTRLYAADGDGVLIFGAKRKRQTQDR